MPSGGRAVESDSTEGKFVRDTLVAFFRCMYTRRRSPMYVESVFVVLVGGCFLLLLTFSPIYKSNSCSTTRGDSGENDTNVSLEENEELRRPGDVGT